jgi:hypothetical protein
MKNYQDFIGFYENVFPSGWCEHLINEFDSFFEKGFCSSREGSKLKKDDYYIFLDFRNHPNVLRAFEDMNPMDIFKEGLQNCFEDYCEKYESIKNVEVKCSSVKMQKTDPGQGYHTWHFEQSNWDPARILVYSVFLNTIEDAGETEFLYQKLRIAPKENSVIIWPATFTHTHRGNVVHGDKSKYIITGWFIID